MSPQEKESFDRLSQDDQLKLQAIMQMMDKEKQLQNKPTNEATVKNLDRIDSLIDQSLLKEFLDKFIEIYNDLAYESNEMFATSDLIDYLRARIQEVDLRENKDNNITKTNEGDSIVDESEFNFFQTLAGEQYSEEEIEKYLQSDEYQEELQYSQLEMSDTDNWLNDMFEFFNKRKSLDEGLDYFARIAGLKKIK